MKILFQGDSITDTGRNTDRGSLLNIGQGYAMLCAATLAAKYPNMFSFTNLGISGNRIVDVYARIKADIINLKPDYMSILIGVNDVWHEFGNHNGVDADKFEKIYGMLIEEIRAALPDIKIMILEPFCLRAEATENTDEYPDKWNSFRTEVEKRALKARAVSEKYGLTFVPLQEKLDTAAENTENTYWLWDGVHPTAMGHELIKREWLKAFETL